MFNIEDLESFEIKEYRKNQKKQTTELKSDYLEWKKEGSLKTT